MKTILIHGCDSLLFRDGRPFSSDDSGNLAKTLSLPLPATLAGFLRTQIGNSQGAKWKDQNFLQQMKNIAVRGPLLCHDAQGILLPAPADVVRIRKEDNSCHWMELKPATEWNKCCDIPDRLTPLAVTADGKPDSKPYWDLAHMTAWLEGTAPKVDFKGHEGPKMDDRVHVQIDSTIRKSVEGMLFGVQFLDLGAEWSFLAKVDTDKSIAGVRTFGGERRLAIVEESDQISFPAASQKLKDALGNAKQVRLILATPALFTNGWKPGWIGADGMGTPPGLKPEELTLKLISAAVPRRQPISGWDYEKNKPKALRWMAPAGSVYFFDVVEGDATLLLENTWMEPVSDNEQDRRDGFGLALWGV